MAEGRSIGKTFLFVAGSPTAGESGAFAVAVVGAVAVAGAVAARRGKPHHRLSPRRIKSAALVRA